MVGKSLDSLKVTHDEVINALAMQIAALNLDFVSSPPPYLAMMIEASTY